MIQKGVIIMSIVVLHYPGFSAEAILNETTTSLWFDFVRHGQHRASQPLEVDLQSYLVFMLLRYMARPEIFDGTLAIRYLSATTEYGYTKKIADLNNIGDVSLIMAGLYPESHQARNVSDDYFLNIGRMAFFDLASCLEYRKPAEAKLYKKVGRGLSTLASVLFAARGEGVVQDPTIHSSQKFIKRMSGRGEGIGEEHY